MCHIIPLKMVGLLKSPNFLLFPSTKHKSNWQSYKRKIRQGMDIAASELSTIEGQKKGRKEAAINGWNIQKKMATRRTGRRRIRKCMSMSKWDCPGSPTSRIWKDELNQMNRNTEGAGGSKKCRKYFLKYLHHQESTTIKRPQVALEACLSILSTFWKFLVPGVDLLVCLCSIWS